MLFDGITHVVFDLDGLLIDSEPLWQIAEHAILTEHQKEWNEAIAKNHIGLRLDEAAAVMVRDYQLPMESGVLEADILARMLVLLQTQLTVMPGAQEAIATLQRQGYGLAIASSSALDYIQAAVTAQNWPIPVLASAYEVPKGKPAPDVYLKAVERLGVTAEQCIAFEDSVNGAKAAFAAGLRTVAIPGHGFSADDFAGFTHAVYGALVDVPWPS